jgi:hypothetical protein
MCTKNERRINMSVIKERIINYIKELPDYKLIPLQPLLEMLIDDISYIEKVDFEDLDEDEKLAIVKGREEFNRGETVSLEDIDWD